MAKLRLILFPFSFLYIIVTEIRNFLFRINVLKSKQYDIPVISVGNLSVGGTGKTPMVLYLINLLSQQNLSIAVVSRGYGRKTKGLLWVDSNSSPNEVGDEPLLIKQQFPEINFAVCEKRIDAIDTILLEKEIDIVLLDDAYQHQYVKPSLNILLSNYSMPFYKDFVLPAGNLRELRKNKSRADVIVTTKCPADLSEEKRKNIERSIAPNRNQVVFSSSLKYKVLSHVYTDENLNFNELKDKSIVLVTGIANTNSIESELKKHAYLKRHFKFSDHHRYLEADIEKIKAEIGQNTLVVTTTKDAVKLKSFSELNSVPLYALSVEPKLDNELEFNALILNHVRKN